MKTAKKILKPIVIILLVLCVLFCFLVAPRGLGKTDMTKFHGVYAHRGYFDNENGVPENSLAAFDAAMKKGFGIELDLQITKDGKVVVFHDADLERMCGVQGKVWEYTQEQLLKMKLLDTDYTIPSLEEVLALVDDKVPLLVEYKMDKVDTTVCQQGNAILQEYEGDYMVQAFDPRALLWYKKNAPEVTRGLLCQEYWNDESYAGKPLYLALTYMVENVAVRPDFISYKHTDKDNISLKVCRLLGADTACWTLRSDEDYLAVQDEFDIYIFDSFDIGKFVHTMPEL